MITRKLLFGEGDLSSVGNEHFFAAGWDSPHLPPPHSAGFPPKCCLGEGIEKSIYDRGNRQNESRGIILSTTENKGGKILRDNSPGHHLITRDSIPMTFFK